MTSSINFTGYNIQREQADRYCDKHQQHYVRYQTGSIVKVFCEACAEERKQAHMQDIVTKEMTWKRHKEHGGWLWYQSILDDVLIKNASLDTYVPQTDEQTKNKQLAYDFVREYQRGDVFNIALGGNAGAGKSHLAMGILKELNKADDCKCMFVSAPLLLSEIRASFKPTSRETEQEILARVKQADYLVLDDLGAETGSIDTDKRASDFVAKILYEIMNARQGKATIFTTNLKLQEMRDMYDDKVVSRLFWRTNEHRIIFMGQDERGRVHG